MAILSIQNISKNFGSHHALNGVSFEVSEGQFVSVLGPSGCGKTTLLKCIAGFFKPDTGSVYFNKQNLTHTPSEKRNFGVVFQNYALFPHLTAYENIGFGLKVRGLSKKQRHIEIEKISELVQLTPRDLSLAPHLLSGGQQQRVALARTLVLKPKLLLLDEPFANLDRKLRENLRSELKNLQRQTGITTFFVTHDQEEASYLGDKVMVMNRGEILQYDSPQSLYGSPSTRFVAEFFGDINIFSSQKLLSYIAEGERFPSTSKPFMGIRPENVSLLPFKDEIRARGVVVESSHFNGQWTVIVMMNDGARVKVRQSTEPQNSLLGQVVSLDFETKRWLSFDA